MSLNHSLPTIIISLASLFCSTANTETIDLKCEAVTLAFIQQLVSEDLLEHDQDKQQRANQIALDLCKNSTKTAQQQHERDKQQALENWFFEYHPEKAGNRRLKKTH